VDRLHQAASNERPGDTSLSLPVPERRLLSVILPTTAADFQACGKPKRRIRTRFEIRMYRAGSIA
jgi:hypothetical protein